MPEVIGVQFIKGGLVHYYYPLKNEESLKLNDYCVVDTEHGIHLSKVIHPFKQIKKEHLPEKMKTVLRIATDKDKEQFAANESKEKDAYKLCRQKAIEKKLAMKLVDVSYSLDARKAVFYFTAENRVDFRELVKELAHALKVKIEMRQIGVRDEARRLGGVGCCGRALCCCSFLKDFVSVSIRMAKEQNLSLNPTKVSGLCGRLMCCLSYEYVGKSKSRKNENQDNVVESDKVRDINDNVDERYKINCDCNNNCEQSCKLKEQGIDPGETSLESNDTENNKVEETVSTKIVTGESKPAAVKEDDQNSNNKKHKRRPHHNKHRRFKNKPKTSQQNGSGDKPESSGN